MLTSLIRRINQIRINGHKNKMTCYHCGDEMSLRQVVTQEFAGSSRHVCCHGCAMILDTIASEGLQDEYLALKEKK